MTTNATDATPDAGGGVTACEPTSPHYALGQRVTYRDHHDRIQAGAVIGVEAHWRWGKSKPLLIYEIEHPTYRNKRMNAGIEAILYATENSNAG